MRAYMSQRWSYSVCDALACGTKEMSERVAGIEALAEARAIMAETVPTGPGTLSAYAALPTDYPGICGCRASGIPHSRSEHSPLHPMWDEGFALAKALRSFVEA